MKQPYNWDYTIRVKTKEGTYEYEKDDILEAVKLAEKHPDYEEFCVQQNKPKTLIKRRNNNGIMDKKSRKNKINQSK